jgi:hypothetical protein
MLWRAVRIKAGQYGMKVTSFIKGRATMIAGAFLIPGVGLLIFQFILVLMRVGAQTGLLGLSLGLLSVGLALIAIGIGSEADKRQTELLKRIDTSVRLWPTLLKGDLLTPPGQVAAKEAMSEQCRIEAQKRLDEDTRKIGFVRGEVYQLEDGTWAIHWGGKYPL